MGEYGFEKKLMLSFNKKEASYGAGVVVSSDNYSLLTGYAAEVETPDVRTDNSEENHGTHGHRAWPSDEAIDRAIGRERGDSVVGFDQRLLPVVDDRELAGLHVAKDLGVGDARKPSLVAAPNWKRWTVDQRKLSPIYVGCCHNEDHLATRIVGRHMMAGFGVGDCNRRFDETVVRWLQVQRQLHRVL